MNSTRRYDLDWLRVIAFLLLIFYHIGMYYVSWGWHLKSAHAGTDLEPLMQLLNPWRLPILFIISGVAVKFASDKLALGSFAWQRWKRLTIPFFFGVFVIVPPQTYAELLYTRGLISPGYWDFYLKYMNVGYQWDGVVTPTYNHLWYVLYVLLYTLLILPFLAMIHSFTRTRIFARLMEPSLVLFVPILPFLLYRFTTDISFPETHDVRDDWGAHIRYLSFFLLGIMIAKSNSFWRRVSQLHLLATVLSLGSAVLLSVLWSQWSELTPEGLSMYIARCLRICYIWWTIFALFGWAQRYLNRPSAQLSYLTEAIFPYYILHQTLIIIAGMLSRPWGLNVYLEFGFIVLFTFAGCGLLHEYVIRRMKWLRPLFGLKL
ncbi:MAG: acyltransferase family protein [Pseudobacteriovorax sp.]|nr:acyltransferase family protein [Pseudobacteriovorax sp.]